MCMFFFYVADSFADELLLSFTFADILEMMHGMAMASIAWSLEMMHGIFYMHGMAWPKCMAMAMAIELEAWPWAIAWPLWPSLHYMESMAWAMGSTSTRTAGPAGARDSSQNTSEKSAAFQGKVPRGRSARKTRRRERERDFLPAFLFAMCQIPIECFPLLPLVKIPLIVLF